MARKTDTIPREARLLLTRLEHQHTNADPEEWAELRTELLAAVDYLPARSGLSGDDAKASALEVEFDQARDRALARRRLRLTQAALRAGHVTWTGTVGQFDEFAVPCGDGQQLSMLLPAESVTDDGARVARNAGLTGRCPKCKVAAGVRGGDVVVEHKRRCVAAQFQAI